MCGSIFPLLSCNIYIISECLRNTMRFEDFAKIGIWRNPLHFFHAQHIKPLLVELKMKVRRPSATLASLL